MNILFQAALRAACAYVLLACAATAASAQTILTITNHETGETRVFKPEDSIFAVVGDAQALSVDVRLNLKAPLALAWSLRFEPPEGESLMPRRYDEVGCTASFRSGRAAGMHITSNNPLCLPNSGGLGGVSGSYAVRQIKFGSAGEVTAAEILFSQRSSSSSAAPLLTGLFRYQTAPLSLTLDSEPGFALGEVSQRHHGDSSFFSLKGTTGSLSYVASVPRDLWVVTITPQTGRALRAGAVYRTRRTADARFAGLRIDRGILPDTCLSTGVLTILAMDTTPSGEVQNLHASFEYQCAGEAPTLRGTIRYLQ